MITDNDVRDMLTRKANEVTVSPDAWDRISERITGARRPAWYRNPSRLAVAGIAAAALVAVMVSQVPDDRSLATDVTTTSTTVEVGSTTPESVASAWLLEGLGDDIALAGDGFVDYGDGTGKVRFHGTVETEVWVRQPTGSVRWEVVGASSDLVPIHDLVYDETWVRGTATAEVEGTVTITWIAPEDRVLHVKQVAVSGLPGSLERTVPLERKLPGEAAISVRVVIETADGTLAMSQQLAVNTPDMEYATAVWPATSEEGRDQLQASADDGNRPDLLDGTEAGQGFLGDTFPREEGYEYSYEEFQQGDNNSGEVPYTIDGGQSSSGQVLLRRDGEGGIWYVIGVTSDRMRILATHLENNRLEIVVQVGVDGELYGDPNAPSHSVKAGDEVTVSIPDDLPPIIRLDGTDGTVALVAGVLGY